jgi:predicted acetyltransferase
MVSLVSRSDYSQLIKIWHTCFGDPDEYISDFLKQHEGNTYFVGDYVEEGKLAAALYLIPAKFRIKGKVEDCLYVYAVGTLPEYRKHGFCQEMLDWVKHNIKGSKYTFLVPAGDFLISYYGKRGFKLIHRDCAEKFVVTYCKELGLANATGSFAHFSECRDEILEDVDCIYWEDELKYIYTERKSEPKSPSPQYAPLMLSDEMYEVLQENDVDDIYFLYAME